MRQAMLCQDAIPTGSAGEEEWTNGVVSSVSTRYCCCPHVAGSIVAELRIMQARVPSPLSSCHGGGEKREEGPILLFDPRALQEGEGGAHLRPPKAATSGDPKQRHERRRYP
jgi:hypothetical protein